MIHLNVLFRICTLIVMHGIIVMAPILAQPINQFANVYGPDTKDRCASADGRKQILASLPESLLIGLRNQELSLAEQERRSPDVSGYINLHIEQNCSFATGLSNFQPAYTFDFNGPNQLFSSEVSCHADPDEKCVGNWNILINGDYQVCKVTYTIGSVNNDASFRFKPIRPLPDLGSAKRRFAGYQMTLKATGKQAFPNGNKSASVKLYDVFIVGINPNATNAYRQAQGCDLYPLPPPPPTTPITAPGILAIKWTIDPNKPNELVIYVENHGEGPADFCGWYSVKNAGFPTHPPRQEWFGPITVPAKGTYREVFHQWTAIEWKKDAWTCS